MQTEVGLIPDDWEIVSLGELFTFKNGLNKAKKYFGHGTPIVNYMDVYRRSSLRNSDIAGQVDVNSRELGAYNVRRGDVLFTRTSETVEEIGLASVMLDDSAFTVFSGFVLRGRAVDKRLDDSFKAYCFSPRYFRQQVISRASYTTRALTNGPSLSMCILVCPPLLEQRAIAMALSDVDALLDALERIIAKKRDIKQAAMQRLLTGRSRLPGFRDEWREDALGTLGKFLKGAGVKKDEASSGELPCVRYGDIYIHHNNWVRSFQTWISPEVAAMATRLEKGDLLFAASGETKKEIGKCVSIIYDRESYAGGDIIIYRMANTDALFMGYYLNSEFINAQKASKGQGDAVVHISVAALSSIVVRVPDVAEQSAIAEVLLEIDSELTSLEARRNKARAIKLAMMQELLTGRTRLVPTGPTGV